MHRFLLSIYAVDLRVYLSEGKEEEEEDEELKKEKGESVAGGLTLVALNKCRQHPQRLSPD